MVLCMFVWVICIELCVWCLVHRIGITWSVFWYRLWSRVVVIGLMMIVFGWWSEKWAKTGVTKNQSYSNHHSTTKYVLNIFFEFVSMLVKLSENIYGGVTLGVWTTFDISRKFVFGQKISLIFGKFNTWRYEQKICSFCHVWYPLKHSRGVNY